MRRLFTLFLIFAVVCVWMTVSGMDTFYEEKAAKMDAEADAMETVEIEDYITIDSTEAEDDNPIEETEPESRFEAGVFTEEYKTSSGMTVKYIIKIPEDMNYDTPVILSLHGQGEVGKNPTDDLGIMRSVKELNEERFVIIQPFATYGWHHELQHKATLDLLNHLCLTYGLDDDNVILTGYSLGSLGAWYYAENFTDKWCAVVPVSGLSTTTLNKFAQSNVPLWAIWSNWDTEENVSKMKYAVNQLQEFGREAEVIGTEMENISHQDMAHEAYTQEVFDWMYEQAVNK